MKDKQVKERLSKLHRYSVSNSGAQISIPIIGKNDTMIFGDGQLMLHIKDGVVIKNEYLTDPRRNLFPYSQIPYHFRRVPYSIRKETQSNKVLYVNQIFDFGKAYIQITKINDDSKSCQKFAKQLTFFKTADSALYHEKILNPYSGLPFHIIIDATTERVLLPKDKDSPSVEKNWQVRSVTKKQINNYLKTGLLVDDVDAGRDTYKALYVIDIDSMALYETLDDRIWASKWTRLKDPGRKYKIVATYEHDRPYTPTKQFISVIRKGNLFIKFKQNDTVEFEAFSIAKQYKVFENRYLMSIFKCPIVAEDLLAVMARNRKIKSLKAQKVSLALNPQVSKEQLSKEKQKVRTLSKKTS